MENSLGHVVRRRATVTRPSLPPTPRCRHATHPVRAAAPPLLLIATGQERFRTWHPDGYEFPTRDGDLLYSLTCGAETCEGAEALPVFRGSFVAVSTLANELHNAGRFDSSICPFECVPRVESHALVASELSAFEAGLGVAGLHFPGAEAPPGHGFSSFFSRADLTLTPTFGNAGASTVTMRATQKQCDRYLHDSANGRYGSLVHGPLAVWHRTAQEDDQTARGDCLLFRVTRNRNQYQLWTSFAAHAKALTLCRITYHPEFSALRTPDNTEACGPNSVACMWWAGLTTHTTIASTTT